MNKNSNTKFEDITALVIEDSPMVRKLLFGMLNEHECNCIAVETGKDALDFFQWGNGEVDVVFLDLNLPDCFGAELLNHFYQINPEVRVVIMSSYIPDPARMISIPGVTALLHKPFSYSEFTNILEDTSMAMAIA